MAKKRPPQPARKLEGQKLALVGKFDWSTGSKNLIEAIIRDEGGTIVDGEQIEPDVVVEGNGVGGKPPAAIARIRKKFPSAQVWSTGDLYKRTVPSGDVLAAFARSQQPGLDGWLIMDQRLMMARAKPILEGQDLRGANFNECHIENLRFVDSNLSKASLVDSELTHFERCRLDEANLTQTSLSKLLECSLRNANLHESVTDSSKFTDCDFNGARITQALWGEARADGCHFDRADLSHIDLERAKFAKCTLIKASLRFARLSKANLAGCDFSGADLTGADLSGANLTGANLSKAKLQFASLSGANLTRATIDGADFTHCPLTGVKLAGVDTSKARGLIIRPKRTAGNHIKKMAQAIAPCKSFETNIDLAFPGGELPSIELGLSQSRYGSNFFVNADYSMVVDGEIQQSHVLANKLEQGIINLAERFPSGQLQLGTLTVKASGAKHKPKELQQLVLAAWCEAFSLPVPTPEELQAALANNAQQAQSARESLLAQLRRGPAGVEAWNAVVKQERKRISPIQGADLSKARLNNVNLAMFRLVDCTFAGAQLSESKLDSLEGKSLNFAGANLEKAKLLASELPGAIFDDARLAGANLRLTNLSGSSFRNADLTGAQLGDANLRGADFSNANLTDAEFDDTTFDEKTIFPVGFTYPKGLDWKGPGPRPGAAPPPKIELGSMDFPTFLTNVQANVDAGRVANALRMLRAERFQLFAEVKADSVWGVVKSQSSEERVYACRLGSDGSYNCGTQNLRPCGGLGNAVCKHLLVLVMGLVKGSQLDASQANSWLIASQALRPMLDKEGMSEIFLRYKGAEAGEIDWRPTETIPEDFI